MEKITPYPSTEKSLQGVHPIDKLVVRGGRTWCMDLLDVFVRAGQSVSRCQILDFVVVVDMVLFVDVAVVVVVVLAAHGAWTCSMSLYGWGSRCKGGLRF